MYFRVKKKKNGKKREHIVDVLFVYVWKKTAKEKGSEALAIVKEIFLSNKKNRKRTPPCSPFTRR